MRDYTKNIAVKNLKILLVGFCLLGGGTSTYLITAAIFKDGQPALKIEKIKIPIYDKDSDLQTGSYEFQNFRRYMDSLQQIKLDSKIRPNSIDSLKILKIYKSYEK